MDHQEKTFLVRRISNGWDLRYITFTQDSIPVCFFDPNSNLSYQSDFVYKEAEEKAKINGLLTKSESLEILRNDGKWNDEMESKEVQLSESIKQLKGSLNKLKYQKIQQKKNKAALESAESALNELIKIKTQLETSTIEHFAEITRRRWLLKKCVEIRSEKHKDLISNERFIDRCVQSYYVDSVPSMSAVREISRTEPWRMHWALSKNNSMPLFNCSASEMTDLQYALTMWSRVYDFAFESENRPPDEVIDDDLKFDSWYENEIQRIENENKKSQIDGNWSKGQEVFIPADREGAKEVYALNNQNNRSKIQNRIKHVKEKGPTTEANLPDVKKDLIMQANRQNSEAIMKRSKGST